MNQQYYHDYYQSPQKTYYKRSRLPFQQQTQVQNSDIISRVKKLQLKKLNQQLKKHMIQIQAYSIPCSKNCNHNYHNNHLKQSQDAYKNIKSYRRIKVKSQPSNHVYQKVEQQRSKRLELKRIQLQKKQMQKKQYMKEQKERQKMRRQYIQNEKVIKKAEFLKRKQLKQWQNMDKIAQSAQQLLFKDRKIQEFKFRKQIENEEINRIKRQMQIRKNQLLKQIISLKKKASRSKDKKMIYQRRKQQYNLSEYYNEYENDEEQQKKSKIRNLKLQSLTKFSNN